MFRAGGVVQQLGNLYSCRNTGCHFVFLRANKKNQMDQFVCKQCNFASLYRRHYEQHMASPRHARCVSGVFQTTLHTCHECSYTTTVKYKYDLHMQTEKHRLVMETGSPYKQYYCHKCDFGAQDRARYSKHLLSERHRRTNNDNSEYMEQQNYTYTCEPCIYMTNYVWNYNSHLRSNKHLKRMETGKLEDIVSRKPELRSTTKSADTVLPNNVDSETEEEPINSDLAETDVASC